MTTEIQLIERLRNRLLALGYPAAALKAEVRTEYGRRVDLVAYDTGKPKVVFEVKEMLELPKLTHDRRLPFNPAVRQAQFHASELGAPYFAIFDGEQIWWFDIDTVDGRPRLLSGAIGPSNDAVTTTLSTEPEAVLRLVYELNDLARREWDVAQRLFFVGFALLAKLRAELSGASTEHQLWELWKNGIAGIDDIPRIDKLFGDKDFEYFTRASLILASVNLSELPFADFARAIDEVVFNSRSKIGVFKLPFWLLNLIAVLSQPQNTDSVLDIFSNYGDGVAAIASEGETSRVTSIAPNELMYLWDLLKRLKLGLSPNDLIHAYLPKDYESLSDLRARHFDKVLVMPPFGIRLEREGRPISSEEFFLLTALDWLRSGGRVVALLPENFLFSQRNQEFRDSILERMRLRAVISLEQFMPGTGVQASIVVLDDRSSNSKDYTVAMVRLLNEEIKTLEAHQQSIRSHASIRAMMALLTQEVPADRLPESENLWFVDSSELKSGSWTVKSHRLRRIIESESLFPTTPLGSIATLRKGTPLTLDQNGSLAVIGPASIRQFVIEPTKLDRTTKERLPKQPVVARLGDILIHAVGTYRGHAVAVSPDFEGLYISRNIIVARPNRSIILPRYLAIALNGRFVREQLEQSTVGSVISQLTTRLLETVLIPVPDIDMQQTIVQQVEDALMKRRIVEERLIEIEAEVSHGRNQFQTLIDTFHKGGGMDV